jgi:hypothetical protein
MGVEVRTGLTLQEEFVYTMKYMLIPGSIFADMPEVYGYSRTCLATPGKKYTAIYEVYGYTRKYFAIL